MSLSVRDRAMSAAIAVGLLFSLALAVWLQPARERMGTHQQLGLPPCTFRVLFGLPCPSCGMTTSWAHLVRGQVPSALRANVGGTLLAVAAIAAAPWLLVSAICGRWVGWAPSSVVAVWAAAVAVLVVLVDWFVRLAAG